MGIDAAIYKLVWGTEKTVYSSETPAVLRKIAGCVWGDEEVSAPAPAAQQYSTQRAPQFQQSQQSYTQRGLQYQQPGQNEQLFADYNSGQAAAYSQRGFQQGIAEAKPRFAPSEGRPQSPGGARAQAGAGYTQRRSVERPLDPFNDTSNQYQNGSQGFPDSRPTEYVAERKASYQTEIMSDPKKSSPERKIASSMAAPSEFNAPAKATSASAAQSKRADKQVYADPAAKSSMHRAGSKEMHNEYQASSRMDSSNSPPNIQGVSFKQNPARNP